MSTTPTVQPEYMPADRVSISISEVVVRGGVKLCTLANKSSMTSVQPLANAIALRLMPILTEKKIGATALLIIKTPHHTYTLLLHQYADVTH